MTVGSTAAPKLTTKRADKSIVAADITKEGTEISFVAADFTITTGITFVCIMLITY